MLVKISHCILGLTVLAACASVPFAISHAASPAPLPKSPAAQLGKGGRVYQQRCAGCHGKQMEGGDHAPPLRGPAFYTNWQNKSQRALYSRIISTMPLDDPGSLASDDVLATTLVILDRNGVRQTAVVMTPNALNTRSIRR